MANRVSISKVMKSIEQEMGRKVRREGIMRTTVHGEEVMRVITSCLYKMEGGGNFRDYRATVFTPDRKYGSFILEIGDRAVMSDG